MQIFELHFNPKSKEDRIFDSFIFEPENIQEKELGSLYMAGELTRALPQNTDFLENLSSTIKNEFYTKADISESLRGANNFLDKETKLGNVGWLGNLNFTVINIRNSVLNFTKVGNIKILLMRDGEILDISQNLDLQDVEPYPLKIFSNTASGKLSAEDKILILTKDVFGAISQQEQFLNQLAQVSNEKELKKIFNLNKQAVSEISGLCLLIVAREPSASFDFPKINFKFPSFLKRIPKKAILVSALMLLLTASHFLFKDEKEETLNLTREELEEARSKIIMGESLLILKKEEKAQALFQEAWDILQSIDAQEAAALQESIEKYLNIK